MPWTKSNPPSVAKNWTDTEKEKCVAAANGALQDGGSDEEAIFACIHAAGKSKKKGGKNNMAKASPEQVAQQGRSKRYGIAIREDGHLTKPGEWSSLSDSQFGDPVNFLYPIADKTHAASAKSYFDQHKGKYDRDSRGRVRARINRLCRKYGVDPIGDVKNSAPNAPNGLYLVGEIQLASPDLPEDDPHYGLMRIPAARSAVFNHPWWGDIYLDQDLFESFVDNWSSNVVGHDLAVDPDHDTHQGALAWVRDIEINDAKGFDLWVDPTSAGKEVLGDVWRYASIEYTNNFVDQETGIEYGPTLLGCGATNRPFVHRQDAIQILSEDVLRQAGPQPDASYILLSQMEVQPRMEDQLTEVLFDDTDGIEDGNSQETNELVNEAMQFSGRAEPAVAAEEVSAPAAPQAPQPVTHSQPAPANIDLGGQVVTAAQVQELMRQNAALLRDAHLNRVEKAGETALARGVAPVVVGLAKQILLAANPQASATIKMSVPAEDGTQVAKTLNLFDAVVELLSQIPGRITEMPLSYQYGETVANRGPVGANPYAGEDEMTPEEAEAWANARRSQLNIRRGSDPAEL